MLPATQKHTVRKMCFHMYSCTPPIWPSYIQCILYLRCCNFPLGLIKYIVIVILMQTSVPLHYGCSTSSIHQTQIFLYLSILNTKTKVSTKQIYCTVRWQCEKMEYLEIWSKKQGQREREKQKTTEQWKSERRRGSDHSIPTILLTIPVTTDCNLI